MNTKLLFLIFLLLAACTTVDKPLADDEKAKITGEAKALIDTIIQVCENPDPEKLNSLFENTPDFVSLVGGMYADYNQSLENVSAYFENVKSQTCIIQSEIYTVLDAKTVLYTANSRWETKMKNDSVMVFDPLGMQFLLKKTGDQWKVLSWTEAQ